MNRASWVTVPILAAALVGVPAFASAAGGSHHGNSKVAAAKPTSTPKPTLKRTSTPRPKPTSTPKPIVVKPVTPKPVTVYVGGQVVANGQSLSNGIAKVRRQVPFTIKVPRYVPGGYLPVQLAVTPRQRDVSGGFSTLTYAPVSRSKGRFVAARGFQINQASRPLPFVSSTSTITTTIGGNTAMLNEFKAAGTDLLILTWSDAAGNGYTITTDAATSHLTRQTLIRIASSLR